MHRQALHLTLVDIARRAGVGRSAVSNWRRRYADFPQPVEENRTGPRFDASQVEAWLSAHGKVHGEVTLRDGLWRSIEAWRGAMSVDEYLATATAFLAYEHVQRTDDSIPPRLRWPHLRMLPPRSAIEGLVAACHLIEAQGPRFRDLLLPDLRSLPEERFELLETLYELVQQHRAAELFETLMTLRDGRGKRLDAERTSPEIITRLLIGLAHPLTGVVLDPAAGVGGFLLAAARSRVEPGRAPLKLFGQEVDPRTRRIAQRRLLVHGVDAVITQGDSLAGATPSDAPVKADIVLLDPPYSMRLDASKDGTRWPFGVPPARNADLAWVQDAVTLLAEGGRAFVVLPVGSLFRDGPEAAIRRALVRRGTVEAIISLPAGLHAATNIPLAVWLLRPPRVNAERDPILFIDGSRTVHQQHDGEGHSRALDVDSILEVYAWWRIDSDRFNEEPGFSGVAAVGDVAVGDCDLFPGRHVVPRDLADVVATGDDLNHKVSAWRDAVDDAKPPLDIMRSTVPDRRSAAARARPARRRTVDDLVSARQLVVKPGVVIRQDDLRPTGAPVLELDSGRPRVSRHVSLGDLDAAYEARTQPGDVVFLGTSSSLRAVVDDEGGNVVPAPAQIVRVKDPALDPYALAACLQSRHNQQYAQAVSAMRINVRALEVPELDPAAQRRLAESWRALTTYRRQLEDAMRSTDELADTLVTASMVGLLDPADPR